MIDKNLLSKCRQGDRKAQKHFYNKYVNLLKKYSLQYAVDVPQAKDILQESFIRIFKNLDKVDETKDSITPWMIRIVINEALRVKYKKTRTKEDLSEDLSLYDAKFITTSLNSLELQDLMNIIGKLPHNAKLAFLLKEVEGYSHKEIAASLSIAKSSSRSLLTRAKNRLQELLKIYNCSIPLNTIGHERL